MEPPDETFRKALALHQAGRLAEAQKMVDAAQDAELVVVPRAGHMTTIEAPEPVATALAGLLRRV